MKFNVQIERLVLDGVDVAHHERPALKDAVESELARLMLAGGLSQGFENGGAMPFVNGTGNPVSGEGGPQALGQEIARSVYGGLGK